MNALRVATVASVLGLACAGSPAWSHHSAAMFDQNKRLSLSGTVKEWHFTNPHSWIYLAVPDDKGGEVIWKLEGGSVSHLARSGWTYKSLQVGDKIVAVVAPRLDGEPMASIQSVQFADGNSLQAAAAGN